MMNLVNIEQKVFQLESELRLLKQHVAELRKDFDKEQNTPCLDLLELGFTNEDIQEIRQISSSFGDDWNDPAMDVYDKIYLPVVMENSIQAK
ncbi:MAG: hypothetical protein KA783_07890 [Chitinophagales bacterium]|jgi:hypothetical protein|nr:hypothetical protein [Chitinophagales bacterium]